MYVSENIIPACILHLPKKCTFYKSDVIKIPDIFNQSFRETDFWLRMSCLICDAGLFMFQSRSQWQFIWWTHKKAKYQPAVRQGRLFLGIRGWVDVWRLVVSIFTECKVWGWRQSVVLTPGSVGCVQRADNCHGPERLSRCQIGQSGASQQRHTRVTWPITCHQVLKSCLLVTCHCCEVWLKLSQVVINLSRWMWQEEFTNKTFPHLRMDRQHQTVRTASMLERDTWHW